MRVRIVGALVVAAVMVPMSARASHDPPYPMATGCVQAVSSPVGGAFAPVLSTNVTAGDRCRFAAIRDGGYDVAADQWYVKISRPDGTRVVLSSAVGSPSCQAGVIHPGDWVEVVSNGLARAGEGAGC